MEKRVQEIIIRYRVEEGRTSDRFSPRSDAH